MDMAEVPSVASPPNLKYGGVSAHLHRISSLVKALRGDIFGDLLWTGGVQGNHEATQSLSCRVPSDSLSYLVPLLQLEYHVTRESMPTYDPSNPGSTTCQLRVHLPVGGGCFRTLPMTVVASSRTAWRTVDLCFDIDALAMDADRVYLRFVTASMRQVPDRMAFVTGRIRAKRFCVLDGPDSSVKMGGLLRRARALVASGWTMDDALLGRRSWVAGRWEELSARGRVAMAMLPPAVSDSAWTTTAIDTCRECALCHDCFVTGDIIVNLSCNHNFHVQCPSHNGSGLCTWMDEHVTCPCCRHDSSTLRMGP